MTNFIQGTVMHTQWDYALACDIILSIRNNYFIDIFTSIVPGDEKPVGGQFVPGETCHLMVTFRPNTIHLLESQPLESPLNGQMKDQAYSFPGFSDEMNAEQTFSISTITRGKVVDPHWTIATLSEEQQQVLSVLQNQSYILLETTIGHLLINHTDLTGMLQNQIEQIQPGEYMEWTPARLDLLAVLSPYLAYEYPSSVPTMTYEPLDLSDKAEREGIENQEDGMSFVEGMILDNISTAGQHFSIIMRSRNGQIIEVSDHKIIGEPEDALAEQIVPGETYHLLLMLRPRSMTLVSMQMAESLLAEQVHTQKYLIRDRSGELIEKRIYPLHQIVQGKVVDLDWTIAALTGEQQQVLSALKNETYVLLETTIGQLLTSYEYLIECLGEQAAQVAPGTYLTWEPPHFALLAILGPQIAY